jgi:hypothetical protein
LSTVRLRVNRQDYRRLPRRRSARVAVIVLSRGSDGELRRVSRSVGIRRR